MSCTSRFALGSVKKIFLNIFLITLFSVKKNSKIWLNFVYKICILSCESHVLSMFLIFEALCSYIVCSYNKNKCPVKNTLFFVCVSFGHCSYDTLLLL